MSNSNFLYRIGPLLPLLFVSTVCSAQNLQKLDSLNTELLNATGNKRFEVLNNLFEETKSSDFNTALSFAVRFYDLAIASGDTARVVQGGRMRAYSLMDLGKNSEAIIILTHTLGIAQRNQDTLPDLKKQIKSILNNAGLCYMFLGNYAKALDVHYQSLLIREKEGDKNSIRNALNNIGLVYFNLNDNEKAIRYYLRANEISKELNDFSRQESVFINLGLCYSRAGQNDKAITTIEKIFEICHDKCSDEILKQAFEAFGQAYLAKHDFKRARENLTKSLVISKKQGDARYESENLVMLSEVESELKNERQRLAYLKQSETIAESAKLPSARINIYRGLSDFYQNGKNYELALSYQRKLTQLKDSVYNSQFIKNLTQVESDYEERENLKAIEEKNQILGLQKEVIDRQIKQFYLTSTVTSLIAILLFVSFYFSRKLKAQNHKIMAKNEDLNQANKALEEAIHEKDGLVGIVAHDLRSPLAKTTGLVNLITLSGPVNAQQQEMIEMIGKVCGEGNELIKELLEINTLENESKEKSSAAINVGDYLNQLLTLHKQKASEKGIHMTLDKKFSEDLSITTNAEYLTRILDNLLSNAMKFSNPGTSIELTVTANNEQIIFAVRDEGPGIAENEKGLLFKKFKKLKARPTAGESSTGLGLSIVKTLVERLKGNIQVDSALGQGTTFTVVLPVSS